MARRIRNGTFIVLECSRRTKKTGPQQERLKDQAWRGKRLRKVTKVP